MAHTASSLRSLAEVLTRLAIHPLALEADADSGRVLSLMPAAALHTRSRGPYSKDRLPPEAMSTLERVALTWSLRGEQPAFDLEIGDRWPALNVTLPLSRVMIRYVVPEDVTDIPQPPRGDVTFSIEVKIALEYLAASLEQAARRLGTEPPVTVTLHWPGAEDLPRHLRGSRFGTFPDLAVDRSRCTLRERKAHDDELRAAARRHGVRVRGRRGFEIWLGHTRVRDAS